MATFKTYEGAHKRAAFETAHSNYAWSVEKDGDMWKVKRGKKKAVVTGYRVAWGSGSAYLSRDYGVDQHAEATELYRSMARWFGDARIDVMTA